MAGASQEIVSQIHSRIHFSKNFSEDGLQRYISFSFPKKERLIYPKKIFQSWVCLIRPPKKVVCWSACGWLVIVIAIIVIVIIIVVIIIVAIIIVAIIKVVIIITLSCQSYCPHQHCHHQASEKGLSVDRTADDWPRSKIVSTSRDSHNECDASGQIMSQIYSGNGEQIQTGSRQKYSRSRVERDNVKAWLWIHRSAALSIGSDQQSNWQKALSQSCKKHSSLVVFA